MINSLIQYANRVNLNLNINEKNKDGNYPLLFAAKNNNLKIIELIIEYAVSKNIIIFNIFDKIKCGENPLLYSTINDNMKILKILIDYSCNTCKYYNNIYDRIDISLLIYNAVSNNNTEMIKILINYDYGKKFIYDLYQSFDDDFIFSKAVQQNNKITLKWLNY
ncbi:hypothetical protein U3516DRAFT_670697 [Neocallimastix sp. 'constans']